MISIIRLGIPPLPVKITGTGTCIAKIEHIWQAARRFAKRHGYNVMETYGLVGVAPFQKTAVAAWLGYLEVPYTYPIQEYHMTFIFAGNIIRWRKLLTSADVPGDGEKILSRKNKI